MGIFGSKDDTGTVPTAPTELTPEMKKVLDENTYKPSDSAKYTYFLVQMSENGELPYGENDILVSDCIASYIKDQKVTHLLAQTHGWNTTADKAVRVPFAEFMGGMQNDSAMPPESDAFRPVFVAFIWPAVPWDFVTASDARTKTELLMSAEPADSEIAQAAGAAAQALDANDPEDGVLQDKMRILVEASVDDDDDDDEDDDIKAVRNGDPDSVVSRAKATPAGTIIESVLRLTSPIMRPLESLVFGRLMKRGRTVGNHCAGVLGKIMNACQDRVRLCMMANSLGAHVLVGVMKHIEHLPYKPHAMFFVQGAIANEWFADGGRFAKLVDNVAGPVLCTYSCRDFMLKNIFGPFHGHALGFDGCVSGNEMTMKSLTQIAEAPYDFDPTQWNSVNGSEYIDEGNAIAGGHGDFKEDETTSLYWSAIKCPIDESAYNK